MTAPAIRPSPQDPDGAGWSFRSGNERPALSKTSMRLYKFNVGEAPPSGRVAAPARPKGISACAVAGARASEDSERPLPSIEYPEMRGLPWPIPCIA